MMYSDGFYSLCRGWQLKFALLPKTCDITGKKIWFEYAYKGTAMYTGPGEPIFEHRWHDRAEHLIWRLKHG